MTASGYLSESPDRAVHRRRPSTAEVELEWADEPTSAEPFEPVEDLMSRDPDGVFGGRP